MESYQIISGPTGAVMSINKDKTPEPILNRFVLEPPSIFRSFSGLSKKKVFTLEHEAHRCRYPAVVVTEGSYANGRNPNYKINKQKFR